jgi:hypothetical protein
MVVSSGPAQTYRPHALSHVIGNLAKKQPRMRRGLPKNELLGHQSRLGAAKFTEIRDHMVTGA